MSNVYTQYMYKGIVYGVIILLKTFVILKKLLSFINI